jgi:uncharacterized protein (UPF0333 family)
MNSKKGQLSVEMIIIIGVIILIAIVVGALFIGSSDNAIDNTSDLTDQVNGSVDNFTEQLDQYNSDNGEVSVND